MPPDHANGLHLQPRLLILCGMSVTVTELSPDALAELSRAKLLLTSNHLVNRLASLFGRAFDLSAGAMLRRLPEGVRDGLDGFVTRGLMAAVDGALMTVSATPGLFSGVFRARWFGAASVAVSGFAGGAGGLPSTLLELPVTTTLLMRAILEVARSEGEDLATDEARLACLEVFALGGPDVSDDALESGYFVARLGMAELLRQAGSRGLAGVMPRVVATVASRFGLPVAYKLAGQAIPLAGAAAGAALNVAFLDHFQARARGHFIVRRLERDFGAEPVRAAYAFA